MSLLASRAAVVVAVTMVLPGTILTMSRLFPLPTESTRTSHFEQDGSIQNGSVATTNQQFDTQGTGRFAVRTASSSSSLVTQRPDVIQTPVRRGPQILGESDLAGETDQRKPIGQVFAAVADPFLQADSEARSSTAPWRSEPASSEASSRVSSSPDSRPSQSLPASPVSVWSERSVPQCVTADMTTRRTTSCTVECDALTRLTITILPVFQHDTGRDRY